MEDATDKKDEHESGDAEVGIDHDPWPLRMVDKIGRGLLVLGALVGVPALTIVITIDVILRYAFNSPFDWSIEFNEAVLLLVLFAGLPHATKINSHIRMELFYRHFRGVLRRVANILWAGIGLLFSALLTYRVAAEIPFYIKIDKATEFLGIPFWAMHAFVSVCGLLMAFYFIVAMFRPSRAADIAESDDWLSQSEPGGSDD